MRPRPELKEEYRRKLVHAISQTSPFPPRSTYHTLLGLSDHSSTYQHFRPAELSEIEAEALEIKRRAYSRYAEQIDKALVNKCMQGDAQALRLFYQRFEALGEKQEITVTASTETATALARIFGGTDEKPKS